MSFSKFWKEFYKRYISYGLYQKRKTKHISDTFGIFSPYHFICSSLGIIFIIFFLKHTKDFDSKRVLKHQRRISFVMLLLEIFRMIWIHVYRPDIYVIRFDYCNQVCIFLPILVLLNVRQIFPFLAAISFWGGAGVLLYPLHVFTDYGGFHIMSIQSMISHTLMVLSSFNLARTYIVDLKHDFKISYLLFALMALIAFVFSAVRNVNYMAMLTSAGLPIISLIKAPFHIIFVVGAIDLALYLFLKISKKYEKYILCYDIKEELYKKENIVYEVH